MSDYVPPELWPKIFVKLPIKTVVLCTSVCKKWRSMITSPAFVSDHLSLSRQNNPLLLTPPTITTPKTMSLRFDTDTDADTPLRLSQTLHCPFRISLKCPFRVVGSVDGLLLLSDDLHSRTTTRIILWNPSLRNSVTLPKPSFTSYSEGPYLGFGVESATGDYKVVRFVYRDDTWPPCFAEVYSLRDRSWRTVISDNVYDLVPTLGWTQCFIHNAVHWIGGRQEPGKKHSHQEILLFDLGAQVFKKMALPELSKDHSTNVSVFVVGGLLTISARPFILSNQARSSDMDIWVKTDYYTDLWTKIATLDAWELHVGDWLGVRRLCWEIPTTGSGGGGRDCREIQVPASCSLLLERSAVDRYVFSFTESLVLLDH